jgi:hypothetical protein
MAQIVVLIKVGQIRKVDPNRLLSCEAQIV